MSRPICLWSGPRNVSTALMYSFAQRDDVEVVDEPLYGHYLRVSGSPHPGRDDVMAAMDCDGDRVMQELLANAKGMADQRLFVKHMAHHLVDLDLRFLSNTENIFLIRDPREMLPSLTIQVPAAQLADTGLKRQWELYDSLVDAGQQPAVLDSRELLLNPEVVLQALCQHLAIPFTDTMLHWSAGAIEQDGVWAPHWYHAVHQSTGFAPYVAKTDFPDQLQPLLDECQPWYDNLYSVAIKAA
ncbi:MAG: sulfotransferase family protein [Pseudomonadota bacterium]